MSEKPGLQSFSSANSIEALSSTESENDATWSDWLDKVFVRLSNCSPLEREGKLQEALGTVLKVSGLDVEIGELCQLHGTNGSSQFAEVIGLDRRAALLVPFSSMSQLGRTTRITATGAGLRIPVSNQLLGRIMDSSGIAIDGGAPISRDSVRPILAAPPRAMYRGMIDKPFSTGIKVIDGLLTMGVGQRVGVFAPAGGGKSTLLGMLARGARSDVNVIALIGERGREVREFIDDVLGPEGLARSVIICATSDQSPTERANAAYAATTVAEYFRDQGLNVLLMMDSLTRYGRALREIGLSAGEPPVRRGFPPSTFARLPQLLERSGMGETGSITAIYTVLVEDDELDPIAEEVKSIVDGHFVLSRDLGSAGYYPAIDVSKSLSRLMSRIASRSHIEAARRVRGLIAKWQDIEMLVQLGEYKAGADEVADRAIERKSDIDAFRRQDTDDFFSASDSIEWLSSLS